MYNTEDIDDTTREVVAAALLKLDRIFPNVVDKSSGPLGDALANDLHNTISAAISNYWDKSGQLVND